MTRSTTGLEFPYIVRQMKAIAMDSFQHGAGTMEPSEMPVDPRRLAEDYRQFSDQRFRDILGHDVQTLSRNPDLVAELLLHRDERIRAEAIRFRCRDWSDSDTLERTLLDFVRLDSSEVVRQTAIAALGRGFVATRSREVRKILVEIILSVDEAKRTRVCAYNSLLDPDKYSQTREVIPVWEFEFEDIDWCYVEEKARELDIGG